MADSPFGSPELWRHDDLVAVSRAFDPDLVLQAYRSGVFPMPSRRHLMGWYSPMLRGVLYSVTGNGSMAFTPRSA